MQIQIRWSDVEKSDALGQHVNEQVEHALRNVRDHFTRVVVHVRDDNAGKSGANDKRCQIELRPAGADPLSVEDTGDDFFKVVTTTTKKLERAAHNFVDRHRRR